MIPFIPFQFLQFKTSLNMEQAISRLGRSLPLKREIRNGKEFVSFQYKIRHDSFKAIVPRSGVVVNVRYCFNAEGIYVRAIAMPSIATMLFFIFGFGYGVIGAKGSSFAVQFFLTFILFYLLVWWETVETKEAVQNMFRDSIIK